MEALVRNIRDLSVATDEDWSKRCWNIFESTEAALRSVRADREVLNKLQQPKAILKQLAERNKFAFFGPTGHGKTTTINMLLGGQYLPTKDENDKATSTTPFTMEITRVLGSTEQATIDVEYISVSDWKMIRRKRHENETGVGVPEGPTLFLKPFFEDMDYPHCLHQQKLDDLWNLTYDNDPVSQFLLTCGSHEVQQFTETDAVLEELLYLIFSPHSRLVKRLKLRGTFPNAVIPPDLTLVDVPGDHDLSPVHQEQRRLALKSVRYAIMVCNRAQNWGTECQGAVADLNENIEGVNILQNNTVFVLGNKPTTTEAVTAPPTPGERKRYGGKKLDLEELARNWDSYTMLEDQQVTKSLNTLFDHSITPEMKAVIMQDSSKFYFLCKWPEKHNVMEKTSLELCRLANKLQSFMSDMACKFLSVLLLLQQICLDLTQGVKPEEAIPVIRSLCNAYLDTLRSLPKGHTIKKFWQEESGKYSQWRAVDAFFSRHGVYYWTSNGQRPANGTADVPLRHVNYVMQEFSKVRVPNIPGLETKAVSSLVESFQKDLKKVLHDKYFGIMYPAYHEADTGNMIVKYVTENEELIRVAIEETVEQLFYNALAELPPPKPKGFVPDLTSLAELPFIQIIWSAIYGLHKVWHGSFKVNWKATPKPVIYLDNGTLHCLPSCFGASFDEIWEAMKSVILDKDNIQTLSLRALGLTNDDLPKVIKLSESLLSYGLAEIDLSINFIEETNLHGKCAFKPLILNGIPSLLVPKTFQAHKFAIVVGNSTPPVTLSPNHSARVITNTLIEKGFIVCPTHHFQTSTEWHKILEWLRYELNKIGNEMAFVSFFFDGHGSRAGMVPMIAACNSEVVSLCGLYRILRTFSIPSLVVFNCCQVQNTTADPSTLLPTQIIQLSSSLPNTLTFVPHDNTEYLTPFPAIVNDAFKTILAQPLMEVVALILKKAKGEGIQIWKEESGLPFNFTLA